MSHHYSGPNWGFPYGDARLDLADLYVFPKPGDADKSILIMNVHPSVGFNPPGPTLTEPANPTAVPIPRTTAHGRTTVHSASRREAPSASLTASSRQRADTSLAVRP